MAFFRKKKTSETQATGASRGAKNPSPPSERQIAFAACQLFWGSRGSDRDFEQLDGALRPLSIATLRATRARVPNLRDGTTGQRLARIDSLLTELIEESR